MYQHLIGKLNDIIVFLIILYLALLYFKILKAPNESWDLRMKKFRISKWGNALKFVFPLMLLWLVFTIFWE
jgi:hypothetical protein